MDLYIDPDPPPDRVNQTWQSLASRGAAWGPTWSGSPYSPPDPARQAFPLEQGESFVLVTDGDYYWASESNIPWPLASGTAVYAQVDSVNWSTWYGVVLELDEMAGTG